MSYSKLSIAKRDADRFALNSGGTWYVWRYQDRKRYNVSTRVRDLAGGKPYKILYKVRGGRANPKKKRNADAPFTVVRMDGIGISSHSTERAAVTAAKSRGDAIVTRTERYGSTRSISGVWPRYIAPEKLREFYDYNRDHRYLWQKNPKKNPKKRNPPRFRFHGAFSTKREAEKKERRVSGAFIMKRKVRGATRYIVATDV